MEDVPPDLTYVYLSNLPNWIASPVFGVVSQKKKKKNHILKKEAHIKKRKKKG